MVVALREGLDVDTGKAIVTAIIGWVVVVVLNVVVGMIFGGLAIAGSLLAG
jgi:predicted DNA repair protein MutK